MGGGRRGSAQSGTGAGRFFLESVWAPGWGGAEGSGQEVGWIGWSGAGAGWLYSESAVPCPPPPQGKAATATCPGTHDAEAGRPFPESALAPGRSFRYCVLTLCVFNGGRRGLSSGYRGMSFEYGVSYWVLSVSIEY